MLKKELARLLGVSESIVSRHAKQGMPTDSLERAQRWRKRHLEPGRVKGVRFDPKREPIAKTQPANAGANLDWWVDLPSAIDALHVALLAGTVSCDAPELLDVRNSLRRLPNWRESPSFVSAPVLVWVRLIGHMDLGTPRAATLDQSAVMTLEQYAIATATAPERQPDPLLLMEIAWDLYALDGADRMEEFGEV